MFIYNDFYAGVRALMGLRAWVRLARSCSIHFMISMTVNQYLHPIFCIIIMIVNDGSFMNDMIKINRWWPNNANAITTGNKISIKGKRENNNIISLRQASFSLKLSIQKWTTIQEVCCNPRYHTPDRKVCCNTRTLLLVLVGNANLVSDQAMVSNPIHYSIRRSDDRNVPWRFINTWFLQFLDILELLLDMLIRGVQNIPYILFSFRPIHFPIRGSDVRNTPGRRVNTWACNVQTYLSCYYICWLKWIQKTPYKVSWFRWAQNLSDTLL